MSATLRTVLWLPAHFTEGAASMDRYWHALHRVANAPGSGLETRAFAIRCLLGEPPERVRRRNAFQRGWQKYLAYPWRTGRALRDPGIRVAHVLDHSFAHLLAGAEARRVFKIVTVHDLAPLRDGGDLTAGQRQRFRRMVGHLRLADLVLADSRHSAAEAIELLALDPGKVRVLPLAVDAARFARAPSGGQPAWLGALVNRKVVLSVGSAIGRKNLAALPEIFQSLQRAAPGERAVLLRIGVALPAALRQSLDTILGPKGVVELGPAPDDDLIQAYQRADALLFPSRMEGFGFPVLEAMAAGCPVVCTAVTSLPEVGAGAALYFPLEEPAAAGERLARLFGDPAHRAEVVALGRANAVRFSWHHHWRHLRQIYAAAAGGEPLPAHPENVPSDSNVI